MGSGEKYVLINNITKEWFDGCEIKLAERRGHYLCQISYAGLTISQKGFACFEGPTPAISIYRTNDDHAYVRMNLQPFGLDRDQKYTLKSTEKIIYDVAFYSTRGDSANPKHPEVACLDPNVTVRKQTDPRRSRLNSLPTIFESESSVLQRDDGPDDFTERYILNTTPFFTPTLTNVANENKLLKGVPNISSGGKTTFVESNSRTSKLTPLSSRPHSTYKSPLHSSRVRFRSAPIAQPSQSPAVTSSLMFRCLTLKTSLGKFAALALFLGCIGLVMSAYGTAVFCAAGALAVTGAIACGISMFRKSRPEAVNLKDLPSFMSINR